MKILKLTDKVDDVRYEDARSTLERVLVKVVEGYTSDPDFRATGAVVILLDQTGGRYCIKRECSAMKTSELVALLECAKYQELRAL